MIKKPWMLFKVKGKAIILFESKETNLGENKRKRGGKKERKKKKEGKIIEGKIMHQKK